IHGACGPASPHRPTPDSFPVTVGKPRIRQVSTLVDALGPRLRGCERSDRRLILILFFLFRG
ncbi:hypothetical protein, partial [Stenotrophomonas sp.]|uniref:hypothetical protein n=1 Tax=Stenotrophomonas sp. TaxID=69392 RepID=UPI0028AAB1A3